MHWTRKTIYTLLTIFILTYFLYFYVQNIFLPVQFKRFVTAKAQGYLQRPVTIEEIHFSPWRGFIVRNLTVYQKDDLTRVFAQADEISFHMLLAPIFQQKLILIPSLRVSGPFVQIVREDTNRWNFSDLLAAKQPSPNSWTIAPRKIIVKDGEIAYLDQTTAEPFQEVISDISLDARLSLNKIVRFTLEAQIPRRESAVSIKGNYHIDERKLSSRISAQNIPLAHYLSLVPSTPAPYNSKGISTGQAPYNSNGIFTGQAVVLQKGELTSLDITLNLGRGYLQAQGNVTMDKALLNVGRDNQIAAGVKATDFSVGWQKGGWQAKGHLELPGTNILMAGNRSFKGTIIADIKSLEISSRGLRLQTALNVDGFEAALAEHNSLKGRLATRQTKMALSAGQFILLTDMQLTDGRLGWSQDGFLQSDLNTRQTIVTWHEGRVKVKSDVQFAKALLQLSPQLKLEGHPGGTVAYRYDPGRQNIHHLYAGDLNFTDATLHGVPYVDTVADIRGTVRFQTNTLESDQLAFQAQGADILLSGSLTDFLNPVLDIQAKTDNLDLQKLFAAFPALAQKTTLQPTGTAAVEASYRGTARDPAAADIRASIRLKEAALTSPKFAQEITGVSGEISYQKDLAVWKNCQGLYQSKQYTLNGQLADFSRPTLDLQVASDDLKASAQIKILKQAFQIVTLTGQYLNSSLDVKGDVHLLEGSEPDLDLRGTFALNLEDLAALWPARKEMINKFQPIGTLTGEGLFKGKPDQWRDWALTFTAQAPTVSIHGFHVDDIGILHEQRDRHVSKFNLHGRAYNGDLEIGSSADLTGGDVIAQFSGALENMDLAALRKSNLIKNEFLAGNLAASLNLNGNLQNPIQWKGDGALAVTNGHIWQWNILEGLLGALLVPEFQNVVFTDAQAHFAIADGKIFTEDASLDSKTISLKGEGWIDFDQNIHFDITPVFSELAAGESLSLKKAPSLLLAQTQDYLNIRLTGTLRHPRYKVQALPAKVLEKTTDILKEGGGILKEGIGTILKEIF